MPGNLRAILTNHRRQQVLIDGSQSVECIQSVNPGRGRIRITNQMCQRGRGPIVTAPQDHLMSHIAVPPIRMLKPSDEFHGVQLIQTRKSGRLFVASWQHAVNAATVIAGAKIKLILPSCGIHVGCSITRRYISAIQSAPSGPMRAITGRNQLSVDAKNSAD